VLQAIEGDNLRPWFVRGKAPRVIGYTFFEKTSLDKDDVSAAQDCFDLVVAGSSWCEQILKKSGITHTKTILQGVDTGRFHLGYAEKKRLQNCFVVFSGGKIELRKGQDLVIRAFKVLQDKYDDVLLVNCWYNRWDSATATMSMSPYITFDMPKGSYVDAVNHLLKVNGISPNKAIVLEPVSHSRMAEVYRDTDCGLFPNRCEGGTNLVLMEYMACGKPVIASNNSGHTDILSTEHAILLEDQRPFNIARRDGTIYTSWHEPNLDEIISKLEWAYQNREEIKNIGHAGSRFISQLTWEKAAKEFYGILFPDRETAIRKSLKE
jgi:glycosyltransferase involved in cell wall biosynthesis